ncbi:MAG: S41 family peptidase [Granulosicoccus sp.]
MKDKRLAIPWAALSITILLSACGGSSGKTTPEDDPDQVRELTPNTPTLDTLASNETRTYRIDSGANVSVYSESGNADVALFDNLEQIPDNLADASDVWLCVSGWGFKEDTCTATVPDGEMYAVVLAETDATYTINAVSNCSTETINEWIYRSFQDYYIYASEVPVLNPATFTDQNELVQALRFDDPDPFSNIRDSSAQSAFFEEGAEFGLGAFLRYDEQNQLRVTLTFADSPIGRAGIKRGDIAVSIGGESVDDMSNERFFQLIGNRENPIESTWEFIDGDTGEAKSVTVRIGQYQLNTVLYANSYTHPNINGRIGYIVLSNFIEPSRDELDRVIEQFNEDGVSELILDLRYNGGGRSLVSRRLASQIGGPALDGKLHSRFKHNSEYSRFNYSENFFESLPALNLQRIVVLTTPSTASASERLINTLRPYIDVTTIGQTTRGKAFRSSGRQFCGRTLNAMQTQGVNANDQSVTGGLLADCYADDDLTRNFGAESGRFEGMLSKALNNLVFGACDIAPPAIASRSESRDVPPTTETIYVGDDMITPQ